MQISVSGFSFLSVFNRKCLFLEKLPTTDVQMDACPTAAGAFFHGDWLYHSFVLDTPEVRNLHINFKEVLAGIILAAKCWGKLWCDKHVIISLFLSLIKVPLATLLL